MDKEQVKVWMKVDMQAGETRVVMELAAMDEMEGEARWW